MHTLFKGWQAHIITFLQQNVTEINVFYSEKMKINELFNICMKLIGY